MSDAHVAERVRDRVEAAQVEDMRVTDNAPLADGIVVPAASAGDDGTSDTSAAAGVIARR